MNKISAGKDISDTGMALNDVDKALKTVGISLRDENGIIKDSSGLLDEIAEKWDTWNRNQQNQIATAVAGTNQANIFRSTIGDYKEVLEATTIAENANGSATERMSIYTESLTAKINSFKTTWTELVNDLNLDSLIGTVVDLGTKLLEILNILLNKIPILSSALKGFITVKSINILAGAAISAIKRIAGADGLAGLFDGFIKLKDTMAIVKATMNGVTVETETMSVGSVKLANTITTLIKVFEGAKQKLEIFKIMFVNAGGGVNGFVTALYSILPAAVASLSPLTLVAAGVAAVTLAVVAGAAAWLKYNSYAEQTARAVKTAQEAIDKTKADLDSAQSDLDDTDSKIADLAKQIQDINDKGTLTLADKAQRSELQAQLDNLREIKKTQEDIIKLKKQEMLDDQHKLIDAQYGHDKTVDEWGSNLKGISSRLYDTESASVSQLIANINYLNKSKQDLTITDESYNSQMKEQTTALNEQKLGVLQQIETLTELGDTSSVEYKRLQYLYEEITLILDPSSYPELALDNLITSAGLSDKIKDAFEEGGEKGSETIQKCAGIAAQKIANNTVLKANFAKAFNLDVNDLGIDTLTGQILILFQRMFQDIQDSAQSMTANDVFSEYFTTVESLTEQQTLLNKALGEMQYNGELTSGTVQKLIEKYPELSNYIEIQNGKLVLESKYLNETWEAQKQAAKDKVASQIEETKNTVEAVKTRIAAYMGEAEALQALANSGQDTSKIEVLQEAANNGDVKAARQLGAIITEQQQKQQRAEAGLARLQQIYDNMNMGDLTPTKPSGTSTKKSGSGSGSKTDPEKESYELKKSEIELVQKQLELEKSKLEQQKKGLEQQKSALELDKS